MMSLSFSVLSNCLTCASNQHPLKCSVPLLETIPSRCLQMWGQSGNTLSGKLWGGRLAGLSGTLGPPFESRISLMIFALLVLSRMFLRRLLTGGSSPSQSRPQIPPSSTAVFASAHAVPELDLLQEALSTAAQTTGEHVDTLESSGAFSYSKKKPDHTEMKLRRWTTRTKATHAVR